MRGNEVPGSAAETARRRTVAPVDQLRALAEAIERAASAPTASALAASVSLDAARLADAAEAAGATAAAVVIFDRSGHPCAGAVDGSIAADPGLLHAMLREHEMFEPGPVGPGRASARDPGHARKVLAVVPLGDRRDPAGMLAVLGGADGPRLGPDASAVIGILATAAGAMVTMPTRGLPRTPAETTGEAGVFEHDARAERRRIARELHDGLIQSLYGTGLLIQAQAQRTDLPERGRRTMQGWVERIDRLAQEARVYVGDLEEGGDAVAELGAGLDAIAEAAAAAGLDVSTEVRATEQARPGDEVRRELLQVAREAVSNAVRHAHARRLVIRFEVDPPSDTVVLTVEDDGIGFDPAARYPDRCGLRNMATRAASLGGNLDVVSRPGAGTRIRLSAGLHAHMLASGGP